MAKDSAGFIKNAYLCHDFFPIEAVAANSLQTTVKHCQGVGQKVKGGESIHRKSFANACLGA